MANLQDNLRVNLRAPFKQPLVLAIILIGIILLALYPSFVETYSVVYMSTILMYVILTLSWAIFSGPTHYISLASTAFFGMGIYVSALFSNSLPLSLLVVGGGIASFLLALLIGLLTLRLKGIYFILFTFGVGALIRQSILWWETTVTGTVGRFVVGSNIQTVYYYMVAIFAITLLVAFFIRQSKYGLALMSIGQNEEAAAHIGINVVWLKTVTFAVSAVFMGATGALMATRWTYIDPTIAFNPLISFFPVLMAIFGGTSRLIGPILGATIFTLLQQYLITDYPYLYMLIFGTTLVVVMLFLPNGLVGLLDRFMNHGKSSHFREAGVAAKSQGVH